MTNWQRAGFPYAGTNSLEAPTSGSSGLRRVSRRLQGERRRRRATLRLRRLATPLGVTHEQGCTDNA
jgi:hypothetical protein